MKVTYYGHACILIEINDQRLIFDPFIEDNPLAEKVDIQHIEADYILLSHGHQDHVADVEKIYANTKAKVIATHEVAMWFNKRGVDNIHPMNHGGKVTFDWGIVKMVNAIHSSSLPDGSYGGNPAGFVVESGEHAFYFSGDTALHQDMKQIAEEFNLTFAILPIGDNYTMGIDDALKAASYVGVNKVVGVHFDTFPAIKIDKEKSLMKAGDKNIELVLLNIGDTTVI